MSESGVEQKKRFRLRRRLLILASVLLVAGSVSLYLAIGEDDVEPRLEALRAAGYPTSFAELAQYTKLPEGVPNAAEIYTRAFAAFVPPADEANTPTLGKARLPERGMPLPESMVKAISGCLAANQTCLALLHEAGRIEHCRYDWDYVDELSSWTQQPHREALQRCGWLLGLSMIFHSLDGNTEAVVRDTWDWSRLIESMRREPGVTGHLWRIASRAAILERLERVLSMTAFTDQQLEELDRIVAGSAASLDLKETLITQRCFAIERFKEMDRSGAPPLKYLIRTGEIILWVPGIRGKGLPDTLDYMANYIEAADLPVRERTVRFREIEDALRGRSILHAKARAWAPVVMGRVFELDPRIRVHFDLARTALAIERWRLATGNVPGRLDELAPRYLEQAPIDPFDGRPIRYRRTEPGYVLYSILEDGQDNGGRERADMNSGEPYDLCFIVTR